MSQMAPLLLLPGELRNRIYGYCVEPKRRELLRNPKPTGIFLRSFGDYGSLRYVSRQLRAEFSPIYNANTVTKIHQPDVNSFITTFYPQVTNLDRKRQEKKAISVFPNLAPSSISGIQGNILIKIYFGHSFNATPLACLCLQHPMVRVRFFDMVATLRLAAELDAFFVSMSTGIFVPDLENTIQRIQIQCSRRPEINFLLHPEAQRQHEEAYPQDKYFDARERLVSMGGPAMESFTITMGEYGYVRAG
jgi:hypothetical protein